MRVKAMSTSKAEWFNQARANANRIEQEISGLASGHWQMFQRNYPAFWQQAKEISGLFKDLKPVLHHDRTRLWERFQSVCNETRQKQNREAEARRRHSQLKRDLVRDRIKEARGWAEAAESAEQDRKSVV